jgi:protein-S-isoprenylcysteine O-methyltransferase Ste14
MSVETRRNSVAAQVVVSLLVLVVLALLPLLVSRRWDWWEAWAYAAISLGGFVVSRALAARRHPDLLSERVRSFGQENVKPWDKVLAPLVAFGSALITLTAGLEALGREGPAFGAGAKLAALALILAGFWLGTWALMENRFFSGTVRIQSERGHVVVSSGPYRWVRHPGYAGTLLVYAATPVWLDSWWGLAPAELIAAALALRTALEDQTLQAELAGYAEYAQRVRWRLVPGVW